MLRWLWTQRYHPLSDADIQHTFALLDSDSDGFVDVNDFKAALRTMGIPFKKRDIRRLLTSTPPLGIPRMHLEGFKQYVTKQEAELYALFRDIDREGSGSIDTEHMAHAIHRYSGGEGADHRDVESIMQHLGHAPGGQTTFEEFRRALLLLPSAHVISAFDHWSTSPLDTGDAISVFNPANYADGRRCFIGGLISAAVSRTCVAPLDRWRIIQQATPGKRGRGDTIWAGLRAMHKEGGLRSFWRGNGTHVLKLAPETATLWVTFHYAERWLAADASCTTVREKFEAGVLAGMVSTTVVHPMETIRTRMAVALSHTYAGILDCTRQLWAKAGFRGFYNGYGPAMVYIVPYSGVDLCVFNLFKDLYTERHPQQSPSLSALLFGSTVACTAGQFAAYPFQLLRTRAQAQGGQEHALRSGPLLLQILATEGVRGLYRGMGANLLKLLPAVSISRCTFSLVSDWL